MEKVKDNFYYIKFIDKTIIGMNINELSMDFSIRGRFVTKIIRMIQKSNDEEEKNIYVNKGYYHISTKIQNNKSIKYTSTNIDIKNLMIKNEI